MCIIHTGLQFIYEERIQRICLEKIQIIDVQPLVIAIEVIAEYYPYITREG